MRDFFQDYLGVSGQSIVVNGEILALLLRWNAAVVVKVSKIRCKELGGGKS